MEVLERESVPVTLIKAPLVKSMLTPDKTVTLPFTCTRPVGDMTIVYAPPMVTDWLNDAAPDTAKGNVT